MSSEVTKRVFDALVATNTRNHINTPPVDVVEMEHGRKTYYNFHGQEIFTVCNFVSGTTQYYVTDINAKLGRETVL